MIEMNRVTKVYDTGKVQVTALRGVDLQVPRGEFLAVMGPSGSGKSTLLHILGCLDTPTEGEYRLDGRPVGTLNADELAKIRNENIGFVFQNFNLLPYASTWENVEFPLLIRGVGRRERRRRVAELLEQVGMGPWKDHKPHELSGGQQQRVAIARALVNRPALILADEPTGNLDRRTGEEILDLLAGLWREGTTLVVVTHDPDIAARAQRVIHLLDGSIEREETNGAGFPGP